MYPLVIATSPTNFVITLSEHGVTVDLFESLVKSDSLKDICPKLGKRLLIIKKINEYLHGQQIDSCLDTTSR